MGLRVGVIGTGHLGKQHVRVLKSLDAVDYVACYDKITERAANAAEEFGAAVYPSPEALMAEVDAVSLVVPTTKHTEFALAALEKGLDVFVEKPISDDVEGARLVVESARQGNRILQVGHIERFNGAFENAAPRITNPSFIEIHRLATFSIRGTDVSVVGDLMIHDLDLLFCLLGEAPCEIRAKGAGVLTAGPDIVNARLEYAGGCVANVTASRVSVKPLRKLRVFSPSSYISIDLLKRQASEFRKSVKFDQGIALLKQQTDGSDRFGLEDFVEFESFASDGVEPLRKELEAFCRSVKTREAPPVTGEDGLNALELAAQIVDIIRNDPTV